MCIAWSDFWIASRQAVYGTDLLWSSQRFTSFTKLNLIEFFNKPWHLNGFVIAFSYTSISLHKFVRNMSNPSITALQGQFLTKFFANSHAKPFQKKLVENFSRFSQLIKFLKCQCSRNDTLPFCGWVICA